MKGSKTASLLAIALFFIVPNTSAQNLVSPSSYTCPAPTIYGGLGYCGPTQCSQAQSSKPKCVYSKGPIDYAQRVSCL